MWIGATTPWSPSAALTALTASGSLPWSRKGSEPRLWVGGLGGARGSRLDGSPFAEAGAGGRRTGNAGANCRPDRAHAAIVSGVVFCLARNLLEHSNLPSVKSGLVEVMLGVPANANSNQRFLTAEAFRQAGFSVLGLLNEPSDASIEFGHRDRASRQKKARNPILVYDLGGGTFDASLVAMDETGQGVIASEGIGSLGGDDFDETLAELALDAAGISADERDRLSQAEMFHLQEECRAQKESLHPNTRNVSVDLGVVREGWPHVALPVAHFYERCQVLVQETLNATEDLLAAHGFLRGWLRRGSSGRAEPRSALRYGRGKRTSDCGAHAARSVWAPGPAVGLHALRHGNRVGHPGGRAGRVRFARQIHAPLRRLARSGRRPHRNFRSAVLQGNAIARAGRAAACSSRASTHRPTTSAISATWNAVNSLAKDAPPATSPYGTTFVLPLTRRCTKLPISRTCPSTILARELGLRRKNATRVTRVEP